MIEVKLPVDAQERRLPFYLAMEEWVAHNLPSDEYLFAWRVKPTVICGRNQDMPSEVNLAYCRENGIDVVRRRSGGGCVYADMNNYMFSYIAPGENVDTNFGRYTSALASMLQSLGIDAQISGRNDITVNGAKIAGNAFYQLQGRSIVHGTMLFDIDRLRMASAITPSKAKLTSKAVKSVESRVTSLKDLGLKMTVEEFGKYAIDYLCQGQQITLTKHDIVEIEKTERRYYDPAFLYGRIRNDSPSILRSFKRIDNVGEFYVEISLTPDRKIDRLLLSGDYFFTGDVAQEIEKPLEGTAWEAKELEATVKRLNTGSVIRGLTPAHLLELLT